MQSCCLINLTIRMPVPISVFVHHSFSHESRILCIWPQVSGWTAFASSSSMVTILIWSNSCCSCFHYVVPPLQLKRALWRRELLIHGGIWLLFPSNMTFPFVWRTNSWNAGILSVHTQLTPSPCLLFVFSAVERGSWSNIEVMWLVKLNIIHCLFPLLLYLRTFFFFFNMYTATFPPPWRENDHDIWVIWIFRLSSNSLKCANTKCTSRLDWKPSMWHIKILVLTSF